MVAAAASLSPDQPPMALPIDKRQHFRYEGIATERGAGLRQASCEHPLMIEQRAKRRPQTEDRALLEAPPLQPHHIQTGQSGAIADDAAERDHIAFDARDAADHRRTADPHELMDCRRAPDYRMIADRNMPAHHHVVGDDDLV